MSTQAVKALIEKYAARKTRAWQSLNDTSARLMGEFIHDLQALSEAEPVKRVQCHSSHEWSNQFGEDWTPDVGTRCDCGQRWWGYPTRVQAEPLRQVEEAFQAVTEAYEQLLGDGVVCSGNAPAPLVAARRGLRQLRNMANRSEAEPVNEALPQNDYAKRLLVMAEPVKEHTEACRIRMGRGNFSCSCPDEAAEPVERAETPLLLSVSENIVNLTAFADEEIVNALKAKDRGQYQFYRGFTTALSRVQTSIEQRLGSQSELSRLAASRVPDRENKSPTT